MTAKQIDFDAYQQDFAYCEAIIKKHSKNFHTAFSQLPKDKARAVYAVYAFCRRADDAVDEYQDPELLAQMAQQLDVLKQAPSDQARLALYSYDSDPDHRIWRALALTFIQFDLDYQPFFDLLTGQAQDLSFEQPVTEADLATYSYYVAGSVGLMLLPILSSHAKEIQEPAKKLGEAMQRTNILRDIGEDLRMNRVYLPKETMLAFNLTQDDLSLGNQLDSFIDLWEYEARIAESLYEASFEMMPLIDQDCRESLMAAALIYKEILHVIRKQHYQVIHHKQVVPKQRKLQLLFTAKKMLRQTDLEVN
ncbi:hypothetical protein A5886_001097 [Enterococcus sp. 8G7_MSG3316]|uniref:Uncharacterized protein n=1 Tax=Candidatus Enterococcus testudinis TaxID=1834191 RepID=A0A242A5K9_9ENTE|nr:phytoene/squalene synthase family protein [Enterococcus sp. 8G7_MSG3316]OTN76021.1 hypothetical protein A5886_001097 [Enterococcus sp. 8G7_MSG3316]